MFLCFIVSASINVSNTETTIPCKATDPPRTRLVWTFNQSQIILNQTGDSPYTASETWEKLVKAVLESGDLTLQYLSSDHDGMYTCEQSNDEETRITNSILRIENSSGKSKTLCLLRRIVIMGYLSQCLAMFTHPHCRCVHYTLMLQEISHTEVCFVARLMNSIFYHFRKSSFNCRHCSWCDSGNNLCGTSYKEKIHM